MKNLAAFTLVFFWAFGAMTGVAAFALGSALNASDLRKIVGAMWCCTLLVFALGASVLL